MIAEQTDINTILAAAVGVSVAINGFFLSHVVSDLKEIRRLQSVDGNRLTALEAVQPWTYDNHPNRRRYDDRGRRQSPEGEENGT